MDNAFIDNFNHSPATCGESELRAQIDRNQGICLHNIPGGPLLWARCPGPLAASGNLQINPKSLQTWAKVPRWPALDGPAPRALVTGAIGGHFWRYFLDGQSLPHFSRRDFYEYNVAKTFGTNFPKVPQAAP